MKISRPIQILTTLLLFGMTSSVALAKTTINVNFGNTEQQSYGGEWGTEQEWQYSGPPKTWYWRPVKNGRIPPNAMVGGEERGELLFICQAPFRGNLLPGKIHAGLCHIGWRGREMTIDTYRVLIGRHLDWRKGRGECLPEGAVQGGFERGMPMYVCHAAFYGKGVHPGKLAGDTCVITYGGPRIRYGSLRNISTTLDHISVLQLLWHGN